MALRDADAVRIAEMPSVPGITVIETVGFTRSVPRQIYDRYVLTRVRSGEGRLRYRGATRTFPQGSAFLLHPGEPVEGSSIRKTSEILHVEPSLVARHGGLGAGVAIESRAAVDAIGRIVALSRAPASTLERTSVVGDLLVVISGAVDEAPRRRAREPRAIRCVRELLDAQYSSEITLGELARVAGLSPSYLSRAFRERIGLPPHAYQTVRRVRRASELILAGEAIADAALAVGFYDQSHLTRHFTRIFGFSPGVYARARKGQERTRAGRAPAV